MVDAVLGLELIGEHEGLGVACHAGGLQGGVQVFLAVFPGLPVFLAERMVGVGDVLQEERPLYADNPQTLRYLWRIESEDGQILDAGDEVLLVGYYHDCMHTVRRISLLSCRYPSKSVMKQNIG